MELKNIKYLFAFSFLTYVLLFFYQSGTNSLLPSAAIGLSLGHKLPEHTCSTECRHNILNCKICGEPISGTYAIDIYNNQYHSYHLDELPKCDCCDRLISQALTKGGVKFSDGRNICNLCYTRSLTKQEEISKAFEKVVKALGEKGINLDLNRIRIIGVDRAELMRVVPGHPDNIQGYCQSEVRRVFRNHRQTAKAINHSIYVLVGNHHAAVEAAIAHELMHAWLYENAGVKLSSIETEGLCNYISYIYLKGLEYRISSDFILLLEKNSDPVYGKGFWDIRNKYGSIPVCDLVRILRGV